MYKKQTNKHGVFSNIHWQWHWVTQSADHALPQLISSIIIDVILAVGATILPAVVVQLLAAHTALPNVALVLLGISAALALAQWGRPVNEIVFTNTYRRGRILQLIQFGLHKVQVPYVWNSIPAYDQDRYTASAYGLYGDSTGSEAIIKNFRELLSSALTLLFLLGSLAIIKWWLPLLLLFFALISDRVQRATRSFRRQQRDHNNKLINKVNYISRAASAETGAKDIRLYNFAAEFNAHMQGATHAWAANEYRVYFRTFVQATIIAALNGLCNFAIYGSLIASVIRGAFTASGFTYAFNAVSTTTTQLTQLLTAWNALNQNSDDVDLVRNLFMVENQAIAAPNRTRTDLPTTPQPIIFQHVYFRYPDADHDTIADLNLTISAGAKMALVGANGAGKTTITNLMLGLLEPTSGTILLGDTPINTFVLHNYWQYFAPVFQDSTIAATTIAENVAMSKNVDRQRIHAALEQAGLTTDVARMEHGLDTPLTNYIADDGVELSGGQEQKLMLARALYRDAPVLIMDEPTAALDALAESKIYQEYNQMVTGKTSIFISHRLASTQFADEILFLDHGHITERGQHRDLLATGGGYAELFKIQSRYYQEDAENAD
ncbi:ABC transporter ATP-binding protein [Lacticaseibacillus sharpeae]|uniref:ABC transporter ATP-binding protein n=1 Tax=Lacticaseibacillus sharpeae TaxID=1626 RepID=UPI0006CFCE30|nr:ABC transporter ATP-binding protein [Lacticaseibacillus sharpeae]